ncbi:helix-turn-helix domain-containing protein [Nonomuraea deserti]|uniref:helix-turn-helix domain-containing protein n=1 Tax=Nonomuraea deserti TaxID=1848322 RepID=UPI003F6DAFBB
MGARRRAAVGAGGERALPGHRHRRRGPLPARARGTRRSGPAVRTGTHPMERLTSQELQVVRPAADGDTSREIAAQLFLSPRTVEHHLYRAFRKLGIRSRRELSRIDLGH